MLSPTPPSRENRKKDILTYGSTFPHKCPALTIQRISEWLEQRPDAADIRVHVVGSLSPDVKLPGGQWIHHNRIPFSELRTLLREHCRMAVYFSDYESYGMPPVECLLNGVPCIASDIPSIRENIPSQYLFSNADREQFINTANATYDGDITFTCPAYPTWQKVCNNCVQALLNH